MAIRLDPEDVDMQGLPAVTWEEDRNLFAPDGFGRARVACFIRPDEAGVLQFVSVGSVRHGTFVEARPWQKLASFAGVNAEQLYYSATDRVLLETLAGKSKSGVGRVLTTDGAQVILANFADEKPSVPMHLNCANCTPAEMAILHDRLHREFIAKRDDLVHTACHGEYVWPKDKRFVAYELPAPISLPSWANWAANALAVMIFGLCGFALYWLLIK